MSHRCEVQPVFSWEEGLDSLTLRMVNNSGIYAVGAGATLIIVLMYTVVLAVAHMQLSLFTLILVPVLCGIICFAIMTNLSPLEEWAFYRPGPNEQHATVQVSMVYPCGTRTNRLEGVREARVQEFIYGGGDSWGMVPRGTALRLVLLHDGGSLPAKTVLASQDRRARDVCAAINLFLVSSQAYALEAPSQPRVEARAREGRPAPPPHVGPYVLEPANHYRELATVPEDASISGGAPIQREDSLMVASSPPSRRPTAASRRARSDFMNRTRGRWTESLSSQEETKQEADEEEGQQQQQQQEEQQQEEHRVEEEQQQKQQQERQQRQQQQQRGGAVNPRDSNTRF